MVPQICPKFIFFHKSCLNIIFYVTIFCFIISYFSTTVLGNFSIGVRVFTSTYALRFLNDHSSLRVTKLFTQLSSWTILGLLISLSESIVIFIYHWLFFLGKCKKIRCNQPIFLLYWNIFEFVLSKFVARRIKFVESKGFDTMICFDK